MPAEGNGDLQTLICVLVMLPVSRRFCSNNTPCSQHIRGTVSYALYKSTFTFTLHNRITTTRILHSVYVCCKGSVGLCKGCEWLGKVLLYGPRNVTRFISDNTVQPTPYARRGLTVVPDSSGWSVVADKGVPCQHTAHPAGPSENTDPPIQVSACSNHPGLPSIGWSARVSGLHRVFSYTGSFFT